MGDNSRRIVLRLAEEGSFSGQRVRNAMRSITTVISSISLTDNCWYAVGLYMGDIARRIVLRLAEEGGLFGARVPAGLKCNSALSTPQMSKIDHDTSADLLHTADILQEACGLAVDQITLDSTQVVSFNITYL